MTGDATVTTIDAVATELIASARDHRSGRAATTLVTGTSLRAVLIGLAEHAELAEHDAPPAATLQVITGRVALHTKDREWILDAGQLVPIPAQRHGLTAITDTVVLLTIALH
jgi:quercetin dioxygenase-like cupin family protein